MTPEQIIEMAKQAGFNRLKYVHPKTGVHYSEAYAPDSLQAFAQLVRNAALEEAALASDLIADRIYLKQDSPL